MTAERFRQIRNVFDAALERDTSARTAFLEEACHGDNELRQEVEKLVHARDQDTGWLDAEAPSTAPRLEGRRIGPYEILRSLGEGGMGTVYLAARADGVFRKFVALKIVRPETATAEVLRRFRQEHEILASLEHPNIARIIDGGETEDGLPYLVMEYVDGKPIDVYCNEHRSTVKERVALFNQVCSAVRYAHSKHVVHRDLKPSNVLVTAERQAKLLDFGIAKLLAANEDGTLLRTRSDLLLLTPEYASPEQVSGESVTASSDIYTLGVLLYELLTGRRPYRLQSRIFHEVVRVICEEPPTQPSTVVTQRREEEGDADREPEALSRMRGVSPKDLSRELAGNLDSILLKTLQKDPLQRYRSVEELSGELQNHLRGEPVQARRGATLYALQTFTKRHRWWIIAAVGLSLAGWNGWVPLQAWIVGLLLLAGSALGFWILGRAFGARFAPSWVVEATLKNIAIVGLPMLVLYSLLKSLLHLDFVTILGVLSAIVIGPMLYVSLRWPLRRKLLGPLLLDASRPRNRSVVAGCVLILGLSGFSLANAFMYPSRFGYFTPAGRIRFFILQVSLWTILLIHNAWFSHRIEFRPQGLAASGAFIPWRDIAGYFWEGRIGEFEMLRLRRTGLRKWYPIPVRTLIKHTLRPQVDNLLKQQLTEWPRGVD